MLGAIAAKTSTLRLATGVTCPTVRYHPAIIAQAAATMALVSDGRFTLGVGAGERLNEHVVGQGFPSVRGRHERLREALEIIRLLWQGGYQSYEGRHLQLEDARIFDLPDTPPVIAVAASGEASARLAAELGDGLFATEPEASIVEHYRRAERSGPRYAEVPLAWATDEQQAVQAVLQTSRWMVTGWKVMSELPNPVNFDAASAYVEEKHIRQLFAVGPDPEPHVAKVRSYVEAGFDHIVAAERRPRPGRLPRLLRRRPRRPSAGDELTAAAPDTATAPSAARPERDSAAAAPTDRRGGRSAQVRSARVVRRSAQRGSCAGPLSADPLSGSSARSAPGCPRSWSARSRRPRSHRRS